MNGLVTSPHKDAFKCRISAARSHAPVEHESNLGFVFCSSNPACRRSGKWLAASTVISISSKRIGAGSFPNGAYTAVPET